MIAPHRRGRVRPKTQDGRPLRRYRRRWKIERLFAWLGNFRRLVVRYERHALNYLGLVRLTTILTTIAHCLLADWRRRLLRDRTRLACVSPTSPRGRTPALSGRPGQRRTSTQAPMRPVRTAGLGGAPDIPTSRVGIACKDPATVLRFRHSAVLRQPTPSVRVAVREVVDR
jgi:hypothetical protein